MTPEERAMALRRRQLKARLSAAQGAATVQPAAPTGEAPQYAPNGVPMNAAAKAEIIAKAKGGTGTIAPARLAAVDAFDTYGEMKANQTPTSNTGAFMGNLAQGMTFGFADEIAAGVGSVAEGKPYAAIRDGLRAQQDKLMDERPVFSIAGQVAGSLLPSVAGYKAAEAGVRAVAPGVSATGLPARVGLGAATGAVEGATFGAGTADGGDMAESMKNNALLGGLVGAAAPVAMRGLGLAKDAVVNPIASALNIPSNVRASAAIEKMMQRAGMSAGDADTAIRTAASEGQPEFLLADALGNSGQRGLSGIARQPGDARQMIAEALTGRQGNQGNRVSTFLADALDAPDTAAARGASMKAARGSAADTAYEAARTGAGPVDVRGALGVIDDRLGPMAGSGIADDGIGGKLTKYRSRLAADDPNAATLGGGGNTAVEMADFDRVLMLKQEIGDDIGAAVRAGRNNEARELMKLQKELDAALEASSAPYRSANDGFARASREIDMLDEGAAATSPRIRAADTTAKVANMTPEQRRAFASGYADPLIGKVESAAPGVNKARPLLNDKTKAELGVLARDPGLLERQIGRENTMFETNVAALGGSKTADNLADIADTTAMSASMIGNVVSGRWGAAAGQIADKLMAGATGSNPATREIIAKALMSNNPAAALAPIAKRRATTEPVRKAIEAMIRSGSLRAQ